MTERNDESDTPENRTANDEIEKHVARKERTRRRAGHAAAAAAGTAAGILATGIDDSIAESLNFFTANADEIDDEIDGADESGISGNDSELGPIDFSTDNSSETIESGERLSATDSAAGEPIDDIPAFVQPGSEADPVAGLDPLPGVAIESLVSTFDDEFEIDDFSDDGGDELP